MLLSDLVDNYVLVEFFSLVLLGIFYFIMTFTKDKTNEFSILAFYVALASTVIVVIFDCYIWFLQ